VRAVISSPFCRTRVGFVLLLCLRLICEPDTSRPGRRFSGICAEGDYVKS